MSTLIRFGNKYRSIHEKSLCANRRFMRKLRPISMTSKPYVPKTPYSEKFDYDDKNMMLRRPLSPHITIHKITFNMITSITHRITGVMMASYMITLGFSALLFPSFLHFMMTCHMPTLIHIFVKAAIAGPICYHYFSGIRKLIWCMGHNITKKKIMDSGYYSIGVGAAVMFVLVFIL